MSDEQILLRCKEMVEKKVKNEGYSMHGTVWSYTILVLGWMIKSEQEKDDNE